MSKLMSVAVLSAAVLLSGCWSVRDYRNEPVVYGGVTEYSENENYETIETEYMTIQAVKDNVTVRDVILNRGNCKVEGFKPTTLKYGEVMKFKVCDTNRVSTEIYTDKGNVKSSITD